MTVSDQTHLRKNKTRENGQPTYSDSTPQTRPVSVLPQRSAGGRRGTFSGPLRQYWPLLILGIALGAGVAVYVGNGKNPEAGQATQLAARPIPPRYSPNRAIGYLRAIVEMGPRVTGSEAMSRQQAFLTEFFTQQGADVSLQKTKIRHPQSGESVDMANLVAAWSPERPIRFLLCAHYDTRPFPDQDRKDPQGVFVGANDGASGVAALMEMSHQFADLPDNIGVDVVLFDAEEFVFDERRDDYFLGSIFFAQQYLASPPPVPYQAGVLLDMVGDRELQLLYDRASLRYAKEVTKSIWDTAAKLGVTAFVPRTRMQDIRDDHLPLNQIAKIPTADLIDFDYPRPGFRAPQYWHTIADTPDKCSGMSLAAVTWVVHQWIVDQAGSVD